MEGGLDGWGSGGVDCLDCGGRVDVVFALDDFGQLGEGEAVDLADEDGGHGGVEEVVEEGFGELGRRKTLTPALSPRERGEELGFGALWCVCVHFAPFGRCESGGGGG